MSLFADFSLVRGLQRKKLIEELEKKLEDLEARWFKSQTISILNQCANEELELKVNKLTDSNWRLRSEVMGETKARERLQDKLDVADAVIEELGGGLGELV